MKKFKDIYDTKITYFTYSNVFTKREHRATTEFINLFLFFAVAVASFHVLTIFINSTDFHVCWSFSPSMFLKVAIHGLFYDIIGNIFRDFQFRDLIWGSLNFWVF